MSDEKDEKKAKKGAAEGEAKSEKKSEAKSEKKSEAKSEKKSEEAKGEKKSEAKSEKSAKKGEGGKSEKPKKKKEGDDYVLPASHKWANVWKVWAGIGAVGLVGAAAGYARDPVRFAYAWLFGFLVAVTFALGAIFWVIIQHLSSAGWSVTVRRTAECFAAATPILVVLIIPVVLTSNTLFGAWLKTTEPNLTVPGESEHAALDASSPDRATAAADETPSSAELAANDIQPRGMGRGFPPNRADHVPAALGGLGVRGAVHHRRPSPEEVHHEEVMKSKTWWLRRGFFYGRMVIYLGVWILLGTFLFRTSVGQDRSKDPMVTKRLQRFSAPGLVLLAFSMTFAAFDWIMSLEPSWYSTIFGVTFWSGAAMVINALLILTFLSMRQDNLLTKEVNVEHYHDLGKLLFGFMCFWAYVCFSQFMLIWYAALPEETTFFHHRWDVGPWKTISLLIIFLHFLVPFVFIMSRNIKRNLSTLKWGAIMLLCLHIVDIYWLVMPNVPHQTTFSIHWMDLFCLMGPVGLYLALVFWTMTRQAIIPIGDPRLDRSLHFQNA